MTATSPASRVPAFAMSEEPSSTELRSRRRVAKVADSRARWIGLGYIASTPLDSVLLLGRSLPFYLGVVFALAWTWDLYQGKRPRTPVSAVVVMALLLGWATLSAFWALDRSITLQASVGLMGLVIAALAICDLFGRDFMPALAALGMGTVAAALPVLAAPPNSDRRGQASYLSIDENTLALHLIIGLAALLYLVISLPKLSGRLMALSAFAIVFSAILLVGSRTGVSAALIVTTVGLLLSMRTVRGFLTATLLVMVTYVGFTFLRATNRIPQRILDFFESPEISDGRNLIIARYLEHQNEWLITGVGLFNDATFLRATTGVGYNAHSAFWKSWIELGVVGLSLWLVLLGLVVWFGIRAPARFFVVTAIAGLIPFWYSLGGLWSNDMWVVFGLALAGYAYRPPVRFIGLGRILVTYTSNQYRKN